MDTTKQIGGSHYQMQYQPAVFIKDHDLSFVEGNIFKYLIRHPHKKGKQDLEKALHYASGLTPQFKQKRSFYPILGFATIHEMQSREDITLIYKFWIAINTTDYNQIEAFKVMLEEYIHNYPT